MEFRGRPFSGQPECRRPISDQISWALEVFAQHNFYCRVNFGSKGRLRLLAGRLRPLTGRLRPSASPAKQKMATKRSPRTRISVSIHELAIIFRGESVSGHPGAQGGQPKSENRTENHKKSKIVLISSSFVLLHSGSLEPYPPPKPREFTGRGGGCGQRPCGPFPPPARGTQASLPGASRGARRQEFNLAPQGCPGIYGPPGAGSL